MNVVHQDQREMGWSGSARGFAFSEPISLRLHAGDSLLFDVAADQAAVVSLHGDVVAALLGARHAIHVLDPDEERGDVDRTQLAERLRLETQDVENVENRVRHVDAQAQVQYVALASLPAMTWGHGTPTPFHDGDDGRIDLRLEGAFRLRANDPVRFYRSFLRNTEDLPPADFERIAGALVHGTTVRALRHVATSLESLPRDHRELAAALHPFVGQALTVVGIELEEFEVTRLELPVGMTQVQVHPETAPARV